MIQHWLREDLPKTAAAGLSDLQAETYGVTVIARDLAQITESDRARINGLVLVGIFLILLVLVRKPWLAGYLLLTVLFSYYATLGATTLLSWQWHGRPLGEVDWRVPFFLFTILVAVGEDYNILLMTRAMKERRRRGSVEGMRTALARTGGTITSCGLIMAGTFCNADALRLGHTDPDRLCLGAGRALGHVSWYGHFSSLRSRFSSGVAASQRWSSTRTCFLFLRLMHKNAPKWQRNRLVATNRHGGLELDVGFLITSPVVRLAMQHHSDARWDKESDQPDTALIQRFSS